MFATRFTIVVSLSLVLLTFTASFATESETGSSGLVSLKLSDDFENQMNVILRSRRPVEFEFVSTVVKMVEQDQLPLDLVQSTLLWVRKKKDCEYPFVYFERALRVRAAKLGIVVPEVPTP